MADRIKLLIKAIENQDSWGDFSGFKEFMLDVLQKTNADFEKLTFKYQRSNKEKNIISSLLTRTTVDLKKVSEKLHIRAEELSTLLTTIPAYVYFKDTGLRYMMVNRAFAELAGVQAEQIQGKQVQDLFPGYSNQEYLAREMHVIETGIAQYDIEECLDLRDGTKWINSNIAPIRNPENQIIGIIGISLDITDRKQQEAELRTAKELAEAGTIAKNEFIASISHEFRTPMNGILGLSEMLRGTLLSDKQQELLRGITTSAENLLVLLNDVLDFSAIEAGKMDVDLRSFELKQILGEIQQMMVLRSREKSLRFRIRIDDAIPSVLIGDPRRLRQVMLNLTSNAVKFTEKGSVEVHVFPFGQTDTHLRLRFEVTDTGIGIQSEEIPSLFQVFSRIKKDQPVAVPGTGLGLSICKKLILLMKGEIGVESKPGKGSTFWFTIPFALTEPEPDNPAREILPFPDVPPGMPVLVAEDNAINQKIVTFQLQKMGFKVDVASNGVEAMELFTKKTYRLLILDIQMPLMDGFQVAEQVREIDQETKRHTAIIALTANAMKGDRERYLAAGMDGYVSKPFTHEVLRNAISSVLQKAK
jgi:PAS domain S-box-containing protein